MLPDNIPEYRDVGIYKPRNPKASRYYQCVADHFETLEMIWEERYEQQYGFWRSWIRHVIYRYLDCGDYHCGFARVKCKGCGHEYLLAFSCKRRHFCPSCHQKRVVEFGEWLCAEVLKSVPHRQWVFSIPKRLRIYFMYDRKLLAKLSRCAWNVLSTYLKQSASGDNATPGAVIAVQTFGDFQNFNPHLHVIATDGCFSDSGIFRMEQRPNPNDLEHLFRYEVLKMLKAEGKINEAVIENMLSWHHSGFNVYCGSAIWPRDKDALEKLARYIIRAAFSQERMTYVHDYKTSDGIAKVIYRSKHLNMRDIHNHGPPPITTGTTTQLVYDDAYSQIPPYDDWIQQENIPVMSHPTPASKIRSFSSVFLFVSVSVKHIPDDSPALFPLVPPRLYVVSTKSLTHTNPLPILSCYKSKGLSLSLKMQGWDDRL